MAKPADQWLFYFYLGLLFWLPLPLGSNRSWAIFILLIWVFALSIAWALLFVWGKVYFNKTFYHARFPIILLFLFATWGVIQSISIPFNVVQWLSPEAAHSYLITYNIFGKLADYVPISLNAYLSAGKALESMGYSLLFCLTILLVNDRRRLYLLAITIIVSGVFQALYGSFMSLSGVNQSFVFGLEVSPQIVTGTFVNPNHVAGYLEMCLAIGIGLMLSTLRSSDEISWREFFRRVIYFLLSYKFQIRMSLVIMVIALILTRSRMGNVAFFASMSFMGCVYVFLAKTLSRRVVFLFVSLAIVDVFIVGVWFGVDRVIDSLNQTEIIITDVSDKVHQPLDENLQKQLQITDHKTLQLPNESRDEVSRDTKEMINHFFVTGVGGGGYAISFMRFQGKDIAGYMDHAHNDYLEILAEYGVIGGMLLMLIVIVSFYHALAAIRKRQSYLLRGMAFASAMGIIAILLHSFVDFNLQIPANIALFIVILSLAWIARFQ